MAATPPLQILSSPQTPATPLHGATYERKPTRQSTRIRQRAAAHDRESASHHQTSTPLVNPSSTSPKASRNAPRPAIPHSPRSTPRKPTRRVQVISPSSPNTDFTPPKPSQASSSHLQPFFSSTTTMSEGMLPTPVKTPKKKNIASASAAARALFQDQPLESEIVAPSPRRSRKSKRYNGFSLESFNAEKGDLSRIQIFTDNRDQVPQVDVSESNPFIDQSQNDDPTGARRLAGSSKRRKISEAKRLDPQVEAAIEKDEGMVYVFRGKKVYRRFDDTNEEEEVIDEEDLGLLEHTEDGATRATPLKTLSRKSIKPTRLFQTEQQKLARDLAREEEASTDIEDNGSGVVAGSQEQLQVDGSNGKSRTNGVEKRNRASPFDSWPRVKAGSRSSSASKGQKRSAAEAFEDDNRRSTAAVASNMKQKRTRP